MGVEIWSALIVAIVLFVIYDFIHIRTKKGRVRVSSRRPANRADVETVRVKLNYLIPDDDDVPLRTRFSNVAGINHVSLSGTHRQDLIANCHVGQTVHLIRMPDNVDDPNAVAVFRDDGRDIGFLPREIAAEMAQRLDKGSPVTAKIASIEGFTTPRGGDLLGVRLELTPYRIRRS